MTRFHEPKVYIEKESVEDEGVFDLPKSADSDADDSVLESDFAYVTVTIPGHEVSEGWPKTINTWRNRCLASGWEVKVGLSEAHYATQYHKNGNVKKNECDIKHWWLNAVKNGKYITIAYTKDADTDDTLYTSRTIRGGWRGLSDKEMQEVVKGA